MNGQKTLSLVIPCYNEERTLIPCIERVLAIADFKLVLSMIVQPTRVSQWRANSPSITPR